MDDVADADDAAPVLGDGSGSEERRPGVTTRTGVI